MFCRGTLIVWLCRWACISANRQVGEGSVIGSELLFSGVDCSNLEVVANTKVLGGTVFLACQG